MWSSSLSWTGLHRPGASDTVTLDSSATMPITVDGTLVLAGGITGPGGASTLLNDGVLSFAPLTRMQSDYFLQPVGKFGSAVATLLSWTSSVAPTLQVTAARFDNSGWLSLAGGTLDLSGVRFDNAGVVVLPDAIGQTLQVSPRGIASVVDTLFSTKLVVAASVADFANTGCIAADLVQFQDTVSLADLGRIAGALEFDGTLDLHGGTLDASGYGHVTIHGTVLNGTLVAGGGALTLEGATLANVLVALGGNVAWLGSDTLRDPPPGTTRITLDDGAAVTLDGMAPGATPTIAFGRGANLLVLDGNGAGVTLANLHAGDLIDFANLPADRAGVGGVMLSGAMLDVVGAAGATAGVTLAEAAPGLAFAVQPDAGGGTLVTVACFRAGTRIATPDGDVPVERLAIGDAVLTAGGATRHIKWLGRRAYAAAFVAANRQLRPVHFAPGALAPGVPSRSLELSPQHALLIDGVLVAAGALVNGATITRSDDCFDVAYVHVELDSHDLILAEGAVAETFLDAAGRGMFQNAAEYAVLYPREAASSAPCAPRHEHGETLERIRRTLAARSGAIPGLLRGHVERIAGGIMEGWACDAKTGSVPVVFDLLVDGEPAGTVVANRYRADLDHHDLPACGFLVEVPLGARITLQRQTDGATLAMSPEALAV